MKVLMVTQELNAESANLRVSHDWAAAIAARVERLVVLAGRVGPHVLPANVTVIALRGSPSGSRVGVGLRLLWHYLRLVAGR